MLGGCYRAVGNTLHSPPGFCSPDILIVKINAAYSNGLSCSGIPAHPVPARRSLCLAARPPMRHVLKLTTPKSRFSQQVAQKE